jgi:hypothetical protein
MLFDLATKRPFCLFDGNMIATVRTETADGHGLPRRNAARATRAVSSGTSGIGC